MSSLSGSVFMISSRTFARVGLLAALLSAGAVAGCGVRGNLETPPEAKATGAATSPEAADAGANSAVKPKPHKEFILDGLLR
jgi:predicted small lipoprotein YifL